jgi:ABC-2 type transport system ATP-binding protein
MNPIEVQSITFAYKGNKTVLEDISFAIAQGSVTGLLGVNGAGKSTLTWLLCNMLEPNQGTIKIMGEKLTMDSDHIKAQFGVLPADDPLIEHLTIEEYLTFVGRLYNIEKKLLPDRISQLIQMFGLEEFRKKQNRHLSTGTRRKIGILSTLLHSPKLLIWDEPFNGLDPIASATLKELIMALKGNGMTILFTSQVLEPVEAVCDAVLILDDKRLLLNQTMTEIREQIRAANVQTLEQLLVKLARKPQGEDSVTMPWLKI